LLKKIRNEKMTDNEIIAHMEKLRDGFASEMKTRWEQAKIGIGVKDLPHFLRKREFLYSDDLIEDKDEYEGLGAITHHLNTLKAFKKEIRKATKGKTILSSFTTISYEVENEERELDEYMIVYEYYTLIEEFNDEVIKKYGENHTRDYLSKILYEGTESIYRESVSCADVTAILNRDVTISTLRKIKYKLCDN
jgi:hypothetical protein